jgi:hypothetical protein
MNRPDAADVIYTGTPWAGAFDEGRGPVPGPAVQWFLRVRDRLEARGLRVTPATRSSVSDGAGPSRLESEHFVVHCPVAGCAGLAALFWDNDRREHARAGRRKVVRRVMVAGLRRCEASPRHTEVEMLAALGEDLAPFAPVPASEEARL